MILRNPNLKEEIKKELLYLDTAFFQKDKPIPFKGKLILYPITVQDYEEFLRVSSCCTLNKDETMEGIMTTHLDFLLNKMEDVEMGQFWTYNFNRLIELVFHLKVGVRCIKCGSIISFEEFSKMISQGVENIRCSSCESQNFEEVIRYLKNSTTHRYDLMINGETITSKDFERLRQIIMYQNFPEYQDDSWVDPEIKEDQRLKQELLSKQGASSYATLEEKIVAVSSQTSYKFSEIYEMSIRKFLLLLQIIDKVITYSADRVGLMTGMVSTKKPLEHWLYHNNKSMYGEAITQDAYTQQIAKANSGF